LDDKTMHSGIKIDLREKEIQYFSSGRRCKISVDDESMNGVRIPGKN
jgi:hypothetical protein